MEMLFLTALAALLPLTHVGEQAAAKPACYVYLNIGEHYGTIYISPATASDFVVLRDQSLSVRFSVANEGNDEAVIALPAGAAGPGEGTVSRSVDGRQLLVPADINWNGPQRTAGAQGATLSGPLKIPARASVRWRGVVRGFETLAPGRYQIKVQSRLADDHGRPLPVNNDSLTVELREVREFADRVESLRIAAVRALAHNDMNGAERAISELFRVYPNSAFGYMTRGEVALNRGDKTAAAIAFQRALDLVRSRADSLYVSNATEHRIDEFTGALQARLNQLAR